MNYKEEINKKGYLIINNVFTEEEINIFKNEILEYIKNNKTIIDSSGITIPNFIKNNNLIKTASIKNNKIILNVLDKIFGKNKYRFCSHNDIGINRIVGWHKDKLNNKYSKYETINIWNKYNDEKHEIVKILIYLQDHSNNNNALKLVPGSHLEQKINKNGWIQLKPKIGDIIIFDQRITHSGLDKQIKETRILVAFGFGKNNIFTDNFERGTIQRQNDQNKILI
jgi:hypothetical protein